MKHTAANLHVAGMTDKDVCAVLMNMAQTLMNDFTSSYKFQIIHHGHCTQNEAEHIHVGHYTLEKTMASSSEVAFITEGITPQEKSEYVEIKFVKGNSLEA